VFITVDVFGLQLLQDGKADEKEAQKCVPQQTLFFVFVVAVAKVS